MAMESLANLESFVRSANSGSFSAAARALALTPAAISRNVATLEKHLNVRLFHRSTRKLLLTPEGERFLHAIQGSLGSLQSAIADMAADREEPSGTLRISVSPSFGVDYVLPLLPGFIARHPRVDIDWRFEMRRVDLIGEGLDAAIGNGLDLSPGVVARQLAPAHMIAVASPGYFGDRELPQTPQQLAGLDGVMMRSVQTGRVHRWQMRNRRGEEQLAEVRERFVFNDPDAIARAAVLGMGVALVPVPHVLPELEQGRLLRLLPQWHVEAGVICLYYANKRLLPARTRVFIDYLAEAFVGLELGTRFAGDLIQVVDGGPPARKRRPS